MDVGNQLPILLIDFETIKDILEGGWESVTNPLDRLRIESVLIGGQLGISYQSS